MCLSWISNLAGSKLQYSADPWKHDGFVLCTEQAGGSSTGYDALLQLPDGQTRRVEPGYARPQTGPTTHFVGNHMTQVDTLAGGSLFSDSACQRRLLLSKNKRLH